jgi:hypothetical protein
MSNKAFCPAVADAWRVDYERLKKRATDQQNRTRLANVMRGSLKRHMNLTLNAHKEDGFSRMEKCRYALRVLDENGWKRSFHQREFHEVSCRLGFAHSPGVKLSTVCV